MAPFTLGTGHRGRVYQIDASGASKLLWTADQPEIFAVAVDSARRSLRRHFARRQSLSHRERQGHRFFAPQAKYIWSLAFAKDGSAVRGRGRSRQYLSRG